MYFSYFVTSSFITFLLIVVLNPLAFKAGLLDQPDQRKQHKEPTPLTGGLAVYLAILITLFIHDMDVVNKSAYIFSATILVCIGLIDDFTPIGFKVRILAQILVGLLITQVADVKIEDLGYFWNLGIFELGLFATPFTIFALVGGINAFNMADGIDGLVGGLTLIVLFMVAVLAYFYNDLVLLTYCLIFIPAIIIFLIFNLRVFGETSGKIFLGDTGSTLFGFIVSLLLIYISQGTGRFITPVTVLWILAVPLIDSVSIMIRRMSQGRSPFLPDRDHLHHILPLIGLSHAQTLLVILTLSFLLSTIGIGASLLLHVPDSILLIVFLLLFACNYLAMGKIKEHVDNRKIIQQSAPNIIKLQQVVKESMDTSDQIVNRRKYERRVCDIPIDFEDRRTGERRQG